jgi:hypothetical protein
MQRTLLMNILHPPCVRNKLGTQSSTTIGFGWLLLIHFATLGPSWNFSLSEILVSLSLQDGLRSGIIIGEPTSQPATQPAFNLH